jgi:hypothetical protein
MAERYLHTSVRDSRTGARSTPFFERQCAGMSGIYCIGYTRCWRIRAQVGYSRLAMGIQDNKNGPNRLTIKITRQLKEAA